MRPLRTSAIAALVACSVSSSSMRSAACDSMAVCGSTNGEMPRWHVWYDWLSCQPNLTSFTSCTSCVEKKGDDGNSEASTVARCSCSRDARTADVVLPSCVIFPCMGGTWSHSVGFNPHAAIVCSFSWSWYLSFLSRSSWDTPVMPATMAAVMAAPFAPPLPPPDGGAVGAAWILHTASNL